MDAVEFSELVKIAAEKMKDVTVHQIFLCTTFRFTSLFNCYTYWLEIKFSFVLVHFNITSMLFYISGDDI